MRPTRFSKPEHLWVLSSPSWSHCEGLIKEFEEAWRRGQSPRIEDFLRADDSERRALLIELIHVDLEFRLKSGESVRVEDYLRTYPELAADRDALLGLIAAEYDLRQRLRGGISPDEYRRRFPECPDDFLPPPVEAAAASEPVEEAPPATECPTVPGYEALEEIGRGGMGVVYKAREQSLGRHVALKFLPAEYTRDPDRLVRFLREARTASALNHPHICTVHALGEQEGRPFLVLEFIEGVTLQALAVQRPRLEEVTRVIGQAARALAAAHAAGVVHRDVKPENIMVRPDGYVKVLDFGLARRLPELPRTTLAPGPDSEPGALVGTVAYMSPEQARGGATDSASDVFSLGLVFYQLATGQHPFKTDSPFGTLYTLANRQPVPPSLLNPEVSAPLAGLLEAMLNKEPRLRPSASEVEAVLAGLGGASVVRAVPAPPPRPIVRREPELAALRAALAAADAGRGSIVCVAGEPGIGKTTLVEDFLGELEPGRGWVVGRGHCSERLAGSEAYLPVLEALADLLRDEAGAAVARLMRVVAPTWYAQIAPTSSPDEPARASSQPAMLREFCHLLQEASRLAAVVLFFDDVHWADVSTVDLLAHLGHHCRRERLLVVVAYRPTELLLGPHPFHRVRLDLLGQGMCTQLPLRFLDRADVDRYLALAFPGHDLPADFTDLVHSRTEGSPLFMADLLRYLRERGVIAETNGRWALAREVPDLRHELPESVRGMIQRKLEWLGPEDRLLLSAAGLQGDEFDSTVVADALGRGASEVEERLQELDRVHGLVRLVREHEFPDRTLSRRYAFVHVLYHQSLDVDLPPSRRAELSAALGRALERREPDGTSAAELACLYEVGRDFSRAAQQLGRAAQNAARVFAHREAIELAERGLRHLDALPPSSERSALEVPLQTTLGLQRQVTEGYAAPRAEWAYLRARELCRQSPGSGPLFPVLWGLWLFAKVRSELARAQELADELLALARQLNDPDLALQAHQALGMTAFCRGEPAQALRHTEEVATLYDPGRHRTHAHLFGQDPGVICKAYGAVALWLLGYSDAAERQSEAAVRMSRDLSPTSQAAGLHFASKLHQLRGDGPRALGCAEASGAIAAEHGFSFWRAGGSVLSGWALAACGAVEEGVARLRQGLLDWQATGSVTYRTWYLGLLAEVLTGQGRVEEAARVLEEALNLVRRTGEGLYEAELYRLRGELALSGTKLGEAAPRRAEEDFRRALDVASRQEARSLGLRAALSLARLARDAGQPGDAQEILAEASGWFKEGTNTPDLCEARSLLTALSWLS